MFEIHFVAVAVEFLTSLFLAVLFYMLLFQVLYVAGKRDGLAVVQ